MTNAIRSQVLTLAHQIKKANGLTFSEAQKAAWKALKAKQQMKTGIVEITFQKTTGEIVTRTATLMPSYLPAPKMETAITRNQVSTKVTYFELSSEGGCFKSFLPVNLITFTIATAAPVAVAA